MVTSRGKTECVALPQRREKPGSIALDQWRGLALLLVLIAHAFHESHLVDGLGRVGVNLFFFISGILVFRSLSSDVRNSRQVALSFWHRRLRRLYPALLAYLCVLLAGDYWLQRLPGQPAGSDYANLLRHTPAALLYFINYMPMAPRSVGHLWSLACEMQFYLLSPLIFFLGGKTRWRRNVVFGGLLLVLMGLGAGEPFLVEHPYDFHKYHFEFAVWPMMLGFWCEFQRLWILKIPAAWLKAPFWFFLALTLACVPLMLWGTTMKGPTVAAGAFLLIPCLLAYLSGWPAGAMPGKVLRWLGERTYSVYLWQQPFTICCFLPVKWWAGGAVVSALWGGVWFHWFERPFLSAGRKQQAPESAKQPK